MQLITYGYNLTPKKVSLYTDHLYIQILVQQIMHSMI